MINLRHRLVLNSDIVIRRFEPVVAVSVQIQDENDFAVTRTASRSPSILVSRETADFLLSFSRPCALLTAVRLSAKRTAMAPEAVLEEMYPHLQTFLERAILVRLGGVRRHPKRRRIGRWSLERKINDFDDSSVYLAKDETGQFGALKLFQKETTDGGSARERRVLELVGNDLAPALLEMGSSPRGPYHVSAWKYGLVAAEAFAELPASTSSWPALLRLAADLVQTYERLHERSILHGDVQPKNVVFDLHDRPWLIDFSNSLVPGLSPPSKRMGVPFFFEPEYARVLLAGGGFEPEWQVPTLRGENYAVAAMLYYLLSGIHSMELSAERETLFRQIAECEPAALTDRLGAEWKQVDRLLRPFLAKDPAQRPSSLVSLRDGLEALLVPGTAAPALNRAVPTSAALRLRTEPLQRLKAEFGLGSPRLRSFDVVPPRCSVTYGAAGIAYALLRAAELSGDAELLWAADAWIEHAEQHADAPVAFTSAGIDLTRKRIGFSALSAAEPGLFFVKGLVRAAMGDFYGTGRAIHQFLAATTHRPSHHTDVNLGGPGLAIAADRLATLNIPLSTREHLLTVRDRLIANAWLRTRPAFNRRTRLGFAHGVAGMLFASLTAGLSREVSEASGRLQELPVMIRKGIHWPVFVTGSSFMPGWCNGVAGHMLLWTRLWQFSASSDHREMMERTAWGLWESRTAIGNVCCGAAGQAISLAVFGSTVGDPAWQSRARALLDSLQPRWPGDDHPQSLFRGELGLLLAQLECDSRDPKFPVWGASLILPSAARNGAKRTSR